MSGKSIAVNPTPGWSSRKYLSLKLSQILNQSTNQIAQTIDLGQNVDVSTFENPGPW